MASRPDPDREGLRPLPRYQRRRVRAWGRGDRRSTASALLATYPCEVRRVLLRLDRPTLEDAIEQMIARLDTLDGDPDREPDDFEEDDDPAGGNIEDEPQREEWRCAGLFMV